MDIRTRAAFKLVAAVVTLGLLAAGAVVVRTVGGTDCMVPAVVGLPVDSARLVLRSAPVGAAVVEAWVAGDEPQGSVVAQEATSCSGPIRLLVSDGGPAVMAADVPQPYRGLLGGLDRDDPVRRIPTVAGTVYKSDALLVGDCAATRAAVADVQDGDFAVRCRLPLEQRLLQVVLSATTGWWGEPPSGGRGARSGIAENYMGTAWGARVRVAGWELQVDLTISASREAGSAAPSRAAAPAIPGQAADLTDRVNLAVLTVSTAADNVAVDILLTPTSVAATATATTPRPAGQGPTDAELPVTLGELRTLADQLLATAHEP